MEEAAGGADVDVGDESPGADRAPDPQAPSVATSATATATDPIRTVEVANVPNRLNVTGVAFIMMPLVLADPRGGKGAA
ncbi:MAG TPA: hypothetical protein VGM06_07455 [Polyangiaceae bacterium]|jgi:hypothetical protein